MVRNEVYFGQIGLSSLANARNHVVPAKLSLDQERQRPKTAHERPT
jgi:hypothetical protein